MPPKPPYSISNTFFDFVMFLLSFILSIPRSLMMLFGKKTNVSRDNFFYSFLDFIFRLWPKYFWKKPTGMKLGSFFADLYRYLFKI